MEILDRLAAGVDQAAAVVAQVPRDRYDDPTPCEGWSVEYVINHMIQALTMFREIGTTGSLDPATLEGDLIGADAAGSLKEAGDAAVAAWSEPGKIDGMAAMPWGEMPAAFALQLPSQDMLVHSWDVAIGAGLDIDWNDDLVESVAAFAEANMGDPAMRGNDFGPPVEVSADADRMTRLLAFLGRHPEGTA